MAEILTSSPTPFFCLYEKEFKELSFMISIPLRNALLKSFRKKDIRIDPLDQTLIGASLKNDFNGFGIPKILLIKSLVYIKTYLITLTY